MTVIKSSTIAGKGIFATKNIKKGTVIKSLTGEVHTGYEIDDYVDRGIISLDDDFQIGKDEYLLLTPDSFYINHSCDPNAGVRGANLLIAIKQIKTGEEITFDYSTVSGKQNSFDRYKNTEWKMYCQCGSKNCRQVISCIETVPEPVIDKYQKLNILPDFILEQLMLA